jgi:N12 class adenine-specific DNA methylase
MSFFKPEDISKYTIQRNEDWYDVGSAPDYLPPEEAQAAPKKESWQITKGAKAGVDHLQGISYGLVSAFGDALGSESLKEWGLSGYEANMREAEENAGNVRGFTDIEGFGDAVDWALYTAGEQGPMLAASLLSGGVGAIAAKKLATSAAEKIIAAEVAKGVSLDIAKKTAASHLAKAASRGALAGAYGSSAGMETGSIYGETADIEGENKAGNAFAHGAVAGLLDALPQMRILHKLGVGREATDQIAESVKKFVGKQMLAEGSTEGLQTIVEQHAKYWLDNNQGMFQPEHWKEIIDAAAAGALMGGVSAGVTAPFRQKPETNPIDDIQKAQEETRANGGDSLDQATAGAGGLLSAVKAWHPMDRTNPQFTPPPFEPVQPVQNNPLAIVPNEINATYPAEARNTMPELPPLEGELLEKDPQLGIDRLRLDRPFIDGQQGDPELGGPDNWIGKEDKPLITRRNDRERLALPPPMEKAKVAKLDNESTDSGQSFDPKRKQARVNLDELTLSEDVPQFKSGASKDGVVEQLRGEYDEVGMAPIQVWVRKNGKKEILTGRHRFDLAKRSNQKDIPAQLHYEADGFTADHGKALDAILNIRDNQGSVKDYVEFFRSSGITEQESEKLGITSRQLGRRAYTIAKEGSDSLVTALRNDQITEAAAEAITRVAPKDEAYQAIGLKAIQDGKTQSVAVNMIRAAKTLKSKPDMTQEGDLFGFDDSAMKQAEAMAKAASSKQRQIKERIAAVKGAAKNPKLAKQEGVDVKDPESLKRRIAELTAEAERYEEWHKHPDLLREIQSEVSGQDFQLETQTEESLAQQEAEATKANQAEAEAKAQEEARIDADKEVDSFTLSGSDSAADIAMANGQTDIFADTPESKTESKGQQEDNSSTPFEMEARNEESKPKEPKVKPKPKPKSEKAYDPENSKISALLRANVEASSKKEIARDIAEITIKHGRRLTDSEISDLAAKHGTEERVIKEITNSPVGYDYIMMMSEIGNKHAIEFREAHRIRRAEGQKSESDQAKKPKDALQDAVIESDSPLYIEEISDKAILVKGDTRTHKDRIKAAGGKWHSRQQGWMFPKSRESSVRDKLADLLGKSDQATPKSDQAESQNTGLAEQMAAMSDDDLLALIDEVANESNPVDNTKPVKERKPSSKKEGGKRKLTPRKTKAEKLESAPSESDKERAAAEIAKSMGVNVSKAGMNAINGLAELFGGKGTLSSGLTFDEQTYEKAKPHFVSMLRDFQAAGKDLKDLIRAILDNFGVGVKPYIVRFAQDIRNGQLEESADDNQINTGNSEEQRGGSGEIREDGADGIGEGDKSPGSDGDGRNGSIDGIGSGESDSSERSNTNNPEAPGFSLENIEGIANGTDKQRVDANLAAIRLMKEIQSSGRYATTDEKNVLAKYVGWGGLSFVFDHTTKKKFAQEAHTELKALLTPTEYNNARSSTRTAFYTSKEIVKAMWQGVEAFGLGGSAMNVVEPSVGSGNFIGWQPSAMREKSKWSASELDTVTGNIAKLIYDDANIQVRGFQDTPFKSNVFSLAIGNPPFGSETITDERNPDISGLRIHNYMIAKSAKLLHEDGLMMMVVTHRFLDTLNENHRNLSSVVDFVGAVRLPNTAFKSNAGTEVTTDIVVFRKLKNGEKSSNTVWTDVNGNIDGIRINKYFESNPQNILGRLANDGTLRAGKEELTVHPTEEYGDIRSAVSIALKEMAKGYNLALTDEIKDSLAGEVLLSESSLPIGGMMLDADGKIQMRGDDTELGASIVEVTPSTPWTANGELLAELRDKLLNDETAFETAFRENLTNNGGALKSGYTSKPFKAIQAYSKREISKATLERELDSGIASSSLGDKYNKLKDLLAIRNTALSLIRAEKQDLGTIEQFRARLNKQYDAFAKTYGSKNKPASISASLNLLRDDISIESGLDSVDKKGNVKKHKIFSQRMMQPYKKPTKASDIHDAVNYSIREHGKVDIGYIAKLLGVSKLQARESLTKGNRPYLLKDPAIDELVFIDDYLSGNVKRKYHEAKDAGLVVNEKLLKSVLPKDKPVNKIKASVRASWMDAEVFEQFLQDVGIKAKVNVNRQLGTVRIATVNGSSNTEIGAQFKNDYKGIPELFEAAAAGKSLVIYTKDGNGNQVKHEEGTKQVNVLVNKMAQVFNTWASNNSSIMDRIAKNFNERVNTHIERKFNGRLYFTPVGQNPTIEMRKTQLDGALRMVQSKNVLLDHTVGAGKTFTSISGIMQRKRLGLSKKPMVVVPNHIIGAFTADFYELYPGANILTATEKQMKPAHRKQFFSRIATGDYDAVIIGHSHLRYLPNSLDSFAAVVNEKISELRAALEEAKSQAKESGRRGSSTKQIEDSISSMVDKIEKKKKAIESSHDAIGFDFSDLGVDYLVVDEAHEFKNLTYSTSSDRVVGMNDPKGSEKALDLLTKTRVVQGLDNGGVTFMTGTPISNSLVEVYTMMYYLGYDVLKDGSISHYDAFAGSFLNTETALEYTPTGSVKERVVLKGLSNMQELSVKYRQFADVITRADMVNIFAEDTAEKNEKNKTNDSTAFPIPKVKGGQRRLDLAPATETQREYNDYLIARMSAIEAIKGRQERKEYASIDNPLWVLSDARKASLDIRLVDPASRRDPTGKVARAAKNIKRIYDQWQNDKGAQLVFSDMGTPAKYAKGSVKKELKALASMAMSDAAATKLVNERIAFYDEDAYSKVLQDIVSRIEKAQQSGDIDASQEEALQDMISSLESSVLTADTGFSVYDDLKASLMEAGVPENEIAFIHDYDSVDKKKALFDQVNSGDVRVLIGSSAKMGAGTNAQKRLVALHHMDAPWRPSDMEQREGRIIRQGNDLYTRDPEGFEVEIVAYATQGSSDPVMWQILERKAAAIEQFRSGGLDEYVDDEGGDADSYAEFKASSTGNPIYKHKLQSDARLVEAQTDYYAASSSRSGAERVIENHDEYLARLYARKEAADKFSVTEFDMQSLDAAVSEQNKKFEKELSAFETAFESYEALSDEAKKGAKKPVRPIRPKIHAITHDYTKLLNERVVVPAMEAINAKVNSWSGSIALGENSSLEVDVSRNAFYSDKDKTVYDIEITYLHGRTPIYSYEKPAMATFIGSEDLLNKLNPLVAERAKSSVISETLQAIEAEKNAYAEAKKVVSKSAHKEKDRLEEERSFNDWLAVEVEVADAKEDQRRSTQANKYIERERKRNVKSSGKSKREDSIELMFEGETYKTLGMKVKNGNLFYDVYPSRNINSGEYVHVYAEKDKQANIEVKGVRHKPDGVELQDISFLESSTLFSINPKITAARKGAAITSAKANEIIDRITASWSKGRDNIVLVESFDDLPSAIKSQAKEYGAGRNEINGVFHEGKIYLVRENLMSALEVEEAIFHEGYGHYGIRKLLGENVGRELMRLFYAIGGARGFNEIAQKNGIDLKAYAEGLAKQPTEAKIQIMMDELLAHLAQSNKPGIKRAFKELIGKIRQFLRDRGFLKLADVDTNELLLVLKNARLAVEGKGPKNYSNNSEVIFNVGDGDERNTRTNSKASDKRLSENYVDYTDIPLMDVDDSGPMFSLRSAKTDEALNKFGLGAKRKAKLSEAINKVVAAENEKSLWSMFKHRAYEGMFDGLIGIDRAEKAVGVSGAENRGYIGARLATGIADVMHAILHYGAPKWKDGALQYKEGTQGLLDILGKAGKDLHSYLAWVGAHRAEELMAQGRENNLTQADIDDLKSRAKGKEALFKEIHREYKKLNKAMLDMAQESGLISAESRAKWESDWYIPFYREIEDEAGNVSLLAPRTSKGLSHQTSGIKQLKGGGQATNDLLENILANWMKLADASMKNSALVKTVDNLAGSDYLEEVAGENSVDFVGKKSDKNIIRIQRDGKPEYYKVNDPALLRAITHLSHPGFHDPVTKVGRYMKRLLTTGITSSPDFILRNFIRDAAHAWAINPDGFKLGVDSIKGLKDALREDPDYRELMFAGASFQGGYVHGTDPEASAQIIRRALEKKGLSPRALHAYESSLLDTPAKGLDAIKQGWQKYRELGDKVENANRLATYKAAKKSGKSILQAAFESKDLMDYSLRGNFAMMQYMIDLVPFMNARLQGMSKLVRAAHENPKRVLVEAGFKLALFSFALAMLNDDDERYQELPDWDKDANWHFWLGDDHYRLPKPFEIGIVFGTIPERLTHTLTGTQDAEKLLWSIKHNLWETMAINPTPQFAMPIIESVANRKFFFDQPIEGMSDEGKIESARYDENTSMTMRVLGEWTGYSPKKLEHLLNGYLGTMGMYALGIADMFADYATGRADKPEWKLEDLPVIKALYRGDTNKSTQYTTDVFDRWSEIDQVFRTINSFKKEGRTEEAEELRADNLEKLRYRRQLGKARNQLGDIRKQMDQLSRNRIITAEAKREKMDGLIEKRNAIAKKYAELTDEVF